MRFAFLNKYVRWWTSSFRVDSPSLPRASYPLEGRGAGTQPRSHGDSGLPAKFLGLGRADSWPPNLSQTTQTVPRVGKGNGPDSWGEG